MYFIESINLFFFLGSSEGVIAILASQTAAWCPAVKCSPNTPVSTHDSRLHETVWWPAPP